MSNPIKTTVHAFHLDLKIADQKAAWLALHETLSDGPLEMESCGSRSHWFDTLPADGAVITLETEHLYANQWNATKDSAAMPNNRVFDFAFDYKPNGRPHIRRGHYLVQTDEMRELRRNRMACGYCGKQEPAQKGNTFCPHCLDSEYLTEDTLHLTRMQAVDLGMASRAKLSDVERDYLRPLYVQAQTTGCTARGIAYIAKERADILKKRDAQIENANCEFDGFTWLMDHGINTGNCIYYPHTGRFRFGWREKIGAAVLPTLVEKLQGFPFPFGIEKA